MFDGLFEFCQLSAGGSAGELEVSGCIRNKWTSSAGTSIRASQSVVNQQPFKSSRIYDGAPWNKKVAYVLYLMIILLLS